MKLEKGQCCVYWIRADHHTDVLTEGYIGVSKNPHSRWKHHFWKAEKKAIKNPIFFNAIQKYGWNFLIKEILIISTEEYCYEFEAKLRSFPKIGWNCNIGGVKPPSSKSRGENYVSPLRGKPRPTPWLVGRRPGNADKPVSDVTRAKISAIWKGRKQSSEHIAKRVASRKATLAAQGRTV